MSALDYKFEGWLGLDSTSVEGKMVWQEFEPKPWEETDIDIKITHSGVCGSDVHSLRSGWVSSSHISNEREPLQLTRNLQGPSPYPLCVGHEIVGIAVRVGSQAEGNIKLGDRVGVGAQNDSCLGRHGHCDECSAGLESYCPKSIVTYGSTHFNGGKAMGGYATHHRCPSHFVAKIPDRLASEHAAPMLCGGLTLYAPLKYHECGPGKKVGIVGIGGLGHFGVLFAKALGAERVVGISRRADKGDEVLKMGADEYIATEDDEGWAARHDKSLDLVISTLSSSKVKRFSRFRGIHFG
jgi:alcohol dehydrogenase (NADP+)